MSNYVLIESRDPFEIQGVDFSYDLAARLVGRGHRVTMFLVENGVLPARPCTRSERLSALADAGVEVVADGFSLRERGIDADRLAAKVKPASLEALIDALADGCKTIWF